MIVERVIVGPVTPGEVFQFDIGQSYPPAQKMPYPLLPGTVILCEETDIVNGATSYLNPFRLFFIQQLVGGAPMPTYTSFYATTAYEVGLNQIPLLGNQPKYSTVNDEVCHSCMITADGPVTAGIIQLLSNARFRVDPGRIATEPFLRIRAHSVILIELDPTHNVGPYIFTDHDIPLNLLEDD